MRQYYSSFSAFGMRLYLDVSKGANIILSKAAVFNKEGIQFISDWMSVSTFYIESINWDNRTKLSG